MKNVLKIGVVAGFTFFSTLLFGKDSDNLVSLRTITKSTINVEVTDAKNVSLYVYNASNGEIYSEKITSKENFIKSYNFKNLPSGTYYLVAESDFKMEKYKIKIKDGKVSIDSTPKKLEKPEYVLDGNRVKLSMDNLKGKVKISISDLSDFVYYNVDRVPENGELNINFDLNPDNSDVYVIKVVRNGEVFKQTFFVK